MGYDQYVGGDTPDQQPVDGLYHYLNHADDTGEFQFDAMVDLNYDEYHGQQYAALEHYYINTRWLADGEGRGDAVATGGDLPQYGEDHYGIAIDQWIISECWDGNFKRTYYRADAILDDGSTINSDTEGDPLACVFPACFDCK